MHTHNQADNRLQSGPGQNNNAWMRIKYRRPDASISRRETEILRLLIIGKTSTEMAQELFLSLDSV